MKSFNILLVLILVNISCKDVKSTPKVKETTVEAVKYSTYGDEIQSIGAVSQSDMWKSYQKLSVSDTLSSKFNATVSEVCQAKGCWMKLKLEDGEEAMVRFKDYGFFMPKDIVGKEVVVMGKAFVELQSIEDQKHFAKDAGKSDVELALILKPKKTYSFEANGVLIKQ
ncbi:DUF4920 domain-containing protein [Flavobacteriaceae bacterium KMM 6897]|nr:DUF4920 domain-containing protein [Flavobacteriaceae bacterium KMM 6897]MEB8344692.1 DUF4920 domain-containing protein [Flavobacteriaceae bacterium KMM 6898]